MYMKVTKVEITTEELEIYDDQTEVIQYIFDDKYDDKYKVELSSEYAKSLDLSRVRQELWLVKEIRHPITGDITKYLVNVDDSKLFQDLISISDSCLNKAVDRRTDYLTDYYSKQHGRLMQYTRMRIKSLPWYKRLFNKF